MSMSRPGGVSAIAVVFTLAAGYLAGVGVLMLLRPGLLSMSAGAFLLNGLETAGPFLFLLAAAAGGLTAWGLVRLHQWARRIAAFIALIGVVMLIPAVSSSVVDFRVGTLIRGGMGIILRVMIAWYLWQPWTREAFENKDNHK
jgi:hypothetical protein